VVMSPTPGLATSLLCRESSAPANVQFPISGGARVCALQHLSLSYTGTMPLEVPIPKGTHCAFAWCA
jgi:hypothetical protein